MDQQELNTQGLLARNLRLTVNDLWLPKCLRIKQTWKDTGLYGSRNASKTPFLITFTFLLLALIHYFPISLEKVPNVAVPKKLPKLPNKLIASHTSSKMRSSSLASLSFFVQSALLLASLLVFIVHNGHTDGSSNSSLRVANKINGGEVSLSIPTAN